jgi:membrane peptidoglycan carboxypeptidase
MRKLIIVIGATLLGASVLATSVFAETTPPPTATARTATAADRHAKAFDRLSDVLSGLVQKGVITAKQKDAILDAVKNAPRDRDFGPREFVGDVRQAASRYLGIPLSDLKAALRQGKSLGEIANATAGKSRDGLVDALDTAADARIKAAVDAGKITQAQAEQIRPKLHDAIAKIVDHKRPTPTTSR